MSEQTAPSGLLSPSVDAGGHRYLAADQARPAQGGGTCEDLDFEQLTFAEVGDVDETSNGCGNLRGPVPLAGQDEQPLGTAAQVIQGASSCSAQEEAELAQEEAELSSGKVVSNAGICSGPASSSSPAKSPRVGPNDFELLRVVGQGAFGKVFQVRKKDTGQVFAMKVMRKEKVLEKEHGEYVRAEREILKTVLHPYIVTLRCSFQTSSKLYLVLDFINGGHLFFQLYRQGIFSEELARLYTAEIVLAIIHLHSLGFVHRDLKPENVLLDSDGHVKVTDFGLAKGNMTDDMRTNSFIGTMEYMAPEIIAGRGHGKTVDWWSVGILLYEMLCGMPPFRAKNRSQLQKQILGGKLKLPPYLGPDAQKLVRALLQREPTKRLGHGPSGSCDVQNHPFFKGINWKKLMDCELPSPFKPTLQQLDSVENFDKIWTDQTAEDSPPASPNKYAAGDSSVFAGFTYVAPSLLTASEFQSAADRA